MTEPTILEENEQAILGANEQATSLTMPDTAGTSCPRCGSYDASRRYYGPCATCREELGVSMQRARRDVEVEAYVPKMNVVPNHIATKE